MDSQQSETEEVPPQNPTMLACWSSRYKTSSFQSYKKLISVVEEPPSLVNFLQLELRYSIFYEKWETDFFKLKVYLGNKYKVKIVSLAKLIWKKSKELLCI